jgi:hypothetical protein
VGLVGILPSNLASKYSSTGNQPQSQKIKLVVGEVDNVSFAPIFSQDPVFSREFVSNILKNGYSIDDMQTFAYSQGIELAEGHSIKHYANIAYGNAITSWIYHDWVERGVNMPYSLDKVTNKGLFLTDKDLVSNLCRQNGSSARACVLKDSDGDFHSLSAPSFIWSKIYVDVWDMTEEQSHLMVEPQLDVNIQKEFFYDGQEGFIEIQGDIYGTWIDGIIKFTGRDGSIYILDNLLDAEEQLIREPLSGQIQDVGGNSLINQFPMTGEFKDCGLSIYDSTFHTLHFSSNLELWTYLGNAAINSNPELIDYDAFSLGYQMS